MYRLMVSTDCGMSYRDERGAETPDELAGRMNELDQQGLRWHLRKDGALVPGFMSRVHAQLIAFMREANDVSQRG